MLFIVQLQLCAKEDPLEVAIAPGQSCVKVKMRSLRNIQKLCLLASTEAAFVAATEEGHALTLFWAQTCKKDFVKVSKTYSLFLMANTRVVDHVEV